MPVTRNDVARAAGVSPAVVSYVLNDGPRPVSTAARERVVKAISDLGYRRDGVARFLKTGSTRSIGLVMPDVGFSYFASMTQRISALASNAGHQVLVAPSNWEPEVERRQLAELAERRVSGIILMSVNPLQDPAMLESLGTPVLLVDRPAVAVDGARVATLHLMDHGRGKVAHLSGPGHLTNTARRDSGWRTALEERGLEARDELVYRSERTRLGGYDAAIAMLSRPDRPDAILIDSEDQALGVLRAAHELGISVPTDLSLATFEGVPDVAPFSIPSLTSVDSPLASIAADAVDRVLTAPPGTGLMRLATSDFELVIRESCGLHA